MSFVGAIIYVLVGLWMYTLCISYGYRRCLKGLVLTLCFYPIYLMYVGYIITYTRYRSNKYGTDILYELDHYKNSIMFRRW